MPGFLGHQGEAGINSSESGKVGSISWIILSVPIAVLLTTGSITYQLDTLKNAAYFISITFAFLAFLLSSGFGKEGIVLSRAFFLYLCFLCLSLVSLLWSDLIFESSIYVALHFANLVLLLLTGNIFRREKDYVLVLPVFAGLLLILSFIGFLERFRIIEPFGAFDPSRIISTMGNAGYLSGILAALVPAACAFALVLGKTGTGVRRFLASGLAWVAPFSGIVALVFTGSRGGMIAAAAGLVFFSFLLIGLPHSGSAKTYAERITVIRTRKISSVIRIILILLIVLGFVLLAIFIALSPSFFAMIRPTLVTTAFGSSSLLNNRLAAWQAAISIWLSEGPSSMLFGRGMGSYYVLGFEQFPPNYLLESPAFGFKHAHNEYLELLADGGLVSLLSWLVLVFLALSRAVHTAWKPGTSSAIRVLATAVAAGIVSILVQNLADPLLRTSSAQQVFYLFTGLAFALPLPGGNGIEGPRLHFSTRIPKILVSLTAVLLLCFSLFQGYKQFHIETALLGAFTAESMDTARVRFDKVLERDPTNIYALYEEMRSLSRSFNETIALAERIEKVIPGFRQTRLLKGLAESLDGQYLESTVSLRRYLAQESFNEAAWAHLVACEIMLGEADAATASLGDYFRARHRYAMRWKDQWFDLEARELRINLSSNSNRVFMEDGAVVAELSAPYLGRIAGLLTARRDAGFVPLLENIFVAMGGLFDELGYGDFSLASYDHAVSLGGMDQSSRNRILAKYRTYYEKARTALASATTKGDRKLEARAKGFVMTYIGYIMKIAPTKELEMEYERLMAKETPAR